MTRRQTMWRIAFVVALVWFMATPAAIGTHRKPSKENSHDQEQYARPTDPSLYVGAETCKSCHEDIYKNFETTPHWKTTFTKKGPQWQGCEACHGPGKEHVEAGGDKSKIFIFEDKSAEQVSKRCLGCHEYGEEHANFDRSQHNINDVSCVACHSPHHAKEKQFLLVKKQPELCYGCHTDIKQDFNRPFRHRVEQGLVQCTDCHNQHGGFLTKQLRATAAQDQVCYKCHTDKAGPFAFEHVPVKTEGCASCHQPHGSTNPRLLKRAQMNLLCLECHTLTQDSSTPGLPSFHNQSQKYQACTSCHVQIHGSNFDEFFFK
jgi:DmsE family decaheme c-type cytochrome